MLCEHHLSFFLKVNENYDNLRFFSGFKENIKLKILCEYGPRAQAAYVYIQGKSMTSCDMY